MISKLVSNFCESKIRQLQQKTQARTWFEFRLNFSIPSSAVEANIRLLPPRGLVLCIKNQAVKTHVQLELPTVLSSKPDRGELSASRPGCFTPRNCCRYPLNTKLGGHQILSGPVTKRNISSPARNGSPDVHFAA